MTIQSALITEKKIESVQNLLNDWSFRSFSLFGKICVVKSPVFIEVFTVLPSPSEQILKELEKGGQSKTQCYC